jgi:hypothetical protein
VVDGYVRNVGREVKWKKGEKRKGLTLKKKGGMRAMP